MHPVLKISFLSKEIEQTVPLAISHCKGKYSCPTFLFFRRYAIFVIYIYLLIFMNLRKKKKKDYFFGTSKDLILIAIFKDFLKKKKP